MADSPQRIQRRRSKGWRMPANTVYVGRGSKWGNPWQIHHSRSGGWSVSGPGIGIMNGICGNEEGARLLAVKLYRRHYEQFGASVHELRGKSLACWCANGQPCHADVLLELANQQPAGREKDGGNPVRGNDSGSDGDE